MEQSWLKWQAKKAEKKEKARAKEQEKIEKKVAKHQEKKKKLNDVEDRAYQRYMKKKSNQVCMELCFLMFISYRCQLVCL